MDNYEEQLKKIIVFIDEYKLLINCHLVDFITDDLWNTCISSSLRDQLHNFQSSNINIFKNVSENNSHELLNFFDQIDNLGLKNYSGVLNIDNLTTFAPSNDSSWHEIFNNNNSYEFMKNKKKHEITLFTKIIGYLSKLNSSLVIDVGSGKGYLATSLYQNYKIPVLAIDSCESRHKSALNRQELIKKKTHQSFPLVHHSIKFIDDTVDFSKLVQEFFKMNDNTINKKDNFLLAGLHTCGPLAVTMIKAFLNSSCLKSLCVVACCYHLTDESLTGLLQLSKNSRMLAQQSVDRSTMKEQPSPSLFYRALLQVLLKSFDYTYVKIGKGGPLNDFPTYATWALKKIGLPENQMPSLSELTNLYNIHLDKEWKLNAFQYLRIHLGSIIEAAIILDRAVYLEQSKKCSKVSIIRLFNPLLSPRCYAIVALK